MTGQTQETVKTPTKSISFIEKWERTASAFRDSEDQLVSAREEKTARLREMRMQQEQKSASKKKA